MRDMNRLIPKAERKAAFLSFLGLAVFVTLVCSIQLPTHHHLPTREYLDDVALATTFGALAGAVLGYIWRLIGAVFEAAI
jgi:hypothetical protein